MLLTRQAHRKASRALRYASSVAVDHQRAWHKSWNCVSLTHARNEAPPLIIWDSLKEQRWRGATLTSIDMVVNATLLPRWQGGPPPPENDRRHPTIQKTLTSTVEQSLETFSMVSYHTLFTVLKVSYRLSPLTTVRSGSHCKYPSNHCSWSVVVPAASHIPRRLSRGFAHS